MTESRTRTQVLCDLVCKLTKTIEFLGTKSTSKYSGPWSASYSKRFRTRFPQHWGRQNERVREPLQAGQDSDCRQD